MKVKILAFAAHPDDIELGASGTLIKHKSLGHSIGIIDLTRGELGTRGSAEQRDQEAAISSKLMQLDIRENLDLGDGFFENNKENKLKVIEAIRAYQPDLILCNAVEDRHIDHGRGALLVSEACFLSGLRKISTTRNGVEQAPWRPKQVMHYIQDRFIKPDLVVDISAEVEKKMECIMAFKTQFYNPESKEPSTPISGEDFILYQQGRWREMGRYIGTAFGEGFTLERPAGISDLTEIS